MADSKAPDPKSNPNAPKPAAAPSATIQERGAGDFGTNPGDVAHGPNPVTKPGGKTPEKAKAGTGGKRWVCSIPKDPLAPRLTVEAQTAGDAERVYKETAGIVATEHVISVGPAPEAPEADDTAE